MSTILFNYNTFIFIKDYITIIVTNFDLCSIDYDSTPSINEIFTIIKTTNSDQIFGH